MLGLWRILKRQSPSCNEELEVQILPDRSLDDEQD